MIKRDLLPDLPLNFLLPANAPVRCTRPAGEDAGQWMHFRRAGWIRKLDSRDVKIKKWDGSDAAEIRFDAQSLSFESDKASDWVWQESAAKHLQAQVLKALHKKLAGSVPVLPDTQRAPLDLGARLNWTEGDVPLDPKSARAQQKKRLKALREFADATKAVKAEHTAENTVQSDWFLRRLKKALGRIPRPADAEIRIDWTAKQDTLEVTWSQRGNCDLIWGARYIDLAGKSPKLTCRTRDEEDVQARREMAAKAMVYAIAQGFANELGRASMKVTFTFLATHNGDVATHQVTLDPTDWGFGLPAMQFRNLRRKNAEAEAKQAESSSKRPDHQPKTSRDGEGPGQERQGFTAANDVAQAEPNERANGHNRAVRSQAGQRDAAANTPREGHPAPAASSFAPRQHTKETKPHAPQASHSTGWVPSHGSVQIAGRDIGGMIYVGTPPRVDDYGYREKCRAYIDPSLPVAREGADYAGTQMPYWPGYSGIPAQCRATYLDWLEGGRSDGSYDPGYMFLYFYGLERRFFLDKPSEIEKRSIVREVCRLKDLYPDNGSVQRYLGEFLQLAQISLNDEALDEPVFGFHGWDLPLSLKVAIGGRVKRGELLAADWVLSWLLCHPERQMRTPATRCSEEFRALFRLRFEDRFPDGLKVNKPRKTLKITYQAASSEFQGQLEPLVDGQKVPDISGLRKAVEIAQEIADEVMDDLDKLSRYLGRNPEGRGSLEAQALLPQELWDLFPSDELEQLRSWAATIVAGDGLVPALDVIERLEVSRPEKLSKRTLIGAADALARLGYGLAPDPRFALRSPKPGEPVVLFELDAPVTQLEKVSERYRNVLIEMALSSFVAHADGQISESERKQLGAKMAAVTGLSAQEHRRLAANLDWMLTVPPDLALLKRKLKDTGPDLQASIRSALVAAAHADGIIQPEEVAGIEQIYKALGLDPALVYSDIHAGGASDGPVRVRAAEPGATGEAIPTEEQTGGARLDAARIAAIRSETARASKFLGGIFDETPEEPEEIENTSSVLVGLDIKQTNLVKALIAQEHWTEDAFEELCRQSGLLAAGAVEDINEWAFETYDEALLDAYDGYEVAPDLAKELRLIFEKESNHVEA